jgi:hypothetical protein
MNFNLHCKPKYDVVNAQGQAYTTTSCMATLSTQPMPVLPTKSPYPTIDTKLRYKNSHHESPSLSLAMHT